MSTLIYNIGSLGGIKSKDINCLRGSEMKHWASINNAWLLIENNNIIDFGAMPFLGNAHLKIDAKQGYVLPAWCDSHTHIVYAGSRENEFVDKINGLSYQEIAKQGGGILHSAQKLQNTSETILFQDAMMRLKNIQKTGTGAVEIKSGYGLNTDAELKMLRVIQKLKAESRISIKATFLGAHSFPESFKNNRLGYIQLITDEMLPQIAQENLADYIDVFCDTGFFTPEETDIILTAGAKYKLKAKIHANELAVSGGVQVGVKHHALSVDHLECVTDAEIECLKNSNTMPTLLPGTAFFLNIPYPPARKMLAAGLPVALASDYNPGSCPSGNMNLIIALACIQMKMLPEEALNAATINGAYAMGLEKELGSITKGKRAHLIITQPVSSWAYLPYSFGENWIQSLLIDGEKIY